MCMFDSKFKDMLVFCLKEALRAESLESSLKKSSEIITSFYPNTKLWFAKRFGKRWSFITGAGADSFTSSQKVEYLEGHAVFLQNFSFKQKKEQEVLMNLFRIITIMHQ